MRTNCTPVPNPILFINDDIQRKRERIKKYLGNSKDYYDHANGWYGDHTNSWEHINTAWKNEMVHQDFDDSHEL